MHKKSLYRKIVLVLLIIGLVPLLAVSFNFNRLVKEHVSGMIRQNASVLLDELAVMLEDKITYAYNNTALLANSEIIRSDLVSLEEKTREMRKIYDLFALFNDITLINTGGVTLISLRDDFRGDWRHKKWFQSAVSGKPGISPVVVTLNPKGFAIVVAAPVFGQDGTSVKAVLAGRVSMNQIWNVVEKIKIGKTGFVFITDSRGKIFFFPDKEKVLLHITPEALKEELTVKQSGTIEFPAEQGIPKICFYKTIQNNTQYGGLNWRIGIIQDKQEAYALIYKMFAQGVLLAIICVLLIFTLTIVFTKKLTKPIMSLAKATKKVAGGNLETHVPITSDDEIGELGIAFNKMVEDLKKSTVSIAVLREQQKRFQDVTGSTGDWIWEVDSQGRYTYSSQAAEQILGYHPEEIVGKYCYDFFPSEEREKLKQEKIHLFNSKRQFRSFIHNMVKKDGSVVIVESSGVPVIDSAGNFLGCRGAYRDITQRKLAEETLKSAYEQLKSTQEQLVQSTKIASMGQLAGGIAHQLNNPLTGVLNNVQLIKLEMEINKDFNLNSFKELLDIVEESALRCKKIIQSFLDLAHVSKGELSPLSLNALVEKVAVIISTEMKLGNIVLLKDLQPDLGDMQGDMQLLEEVILVLVSNARWAVDKKFQGAKGGSITIKTRREQENKTVVITVTDNGIGIAQENIPKLFEPFFTTKKVGEGTGLGLSLIQNIIKKHNGEIIVESQVNVGTTFKISFRYD